MRQKPTATKSQPLTTKVQLVLPKTENQAKLIKNIVDYQLVVATGAAGTGKTFCAVNVALNLLLSGRVTQIILTRPNVSTGRSLGFFPGDIKEKMAPWLAPMISVLRKRLGQEYDLLYKQGVIQIQPLEVIRGASFENAVILVDEAQNLNWEEVKALTTRIGEGSKMVLMGDLNQRDISSSGLTRLRFITKKYQLPVPFTDFSIDDIVRSDLVAQLVRAFVKEEGLKNE